MGVKEIIDGKEVSFRAAVEHFSGEAAKLRTGRANPSIVEDVLVECYGSKMPIQQMASITVPEPRLIVIAPWDQGNVAAVADAIRSSDLGLNPAIDGQLLRLPIPPLTEQRRKEFVKLVHTKAEEARVACRNVRRHVHDELRKAEKDGEMGQDDLRRHEEELQKLTDAHVANIDSEAKKKEAELLEV